MPDAVAALPWAQAVPKGCSGVVIHEMHQDCVLTLPQEASLLASSHNTRVEAWSYRDHVLCIQGRRSALSERPHWTSARFNSTRVFSGKMTWPNNDMHLCFQPLSLHCLPCHMPFKAMEKLSGYVPEERCVAWLHAMCRASGVQQGVSGGTNQVAQLDSSRGAAA
jgi:hypothetical protein